jgi:hypothetical protein
VLLINARPHEINNRDVMAWLTARTKTMAKHESERGFQHRFIRLLKGSLLVKSQNFVSRGEFLLGALQEAFDLPLICFV